MGLAAAPKRLFESEHEPKPEPEPRPLPSADDLQHYLDDHAEGASLDELAAHFGAPRDALAARLRRLESEGSIGQRERHA
jgi:predicted Rossmann fold nucleotide-binding protein DprA/Smf involved in DNA uptake